MKVVIFCGGLGLRMRELSEDIPKPMIRVGDHPILWHIMKYYAYYGHKEFILCLGYQGQAIKRYFLNYREALANDFTIMNGGQAILQLPSEIADWKITLVDTGLHTSIGQRLKNVQSHIGSDEVFLVTYGDNLTDAPIDLMVSDLQKQPDKLASFLLVKSNQSFHVVRTIGENGHTRVTGFEAVNESDLWINGGFFVFRNSIFDYLNDGRELVPDALNMLVAEEKLAAWRHHGFWAAMDTPKEMRNLDALYTAGKAPWTRWEHVHAPDPMKSR
jgi:glucose-1-phosphate cytidylyltransferase